MGITTNEENKIKVIFLYFSALFQVNFNNNLIQEHKILWFCIEKAIFSTKSLSSSSFYPHILKQADINLHTPTLLKKLKDIAGLL